MFAQIQNMDINDNSGLDTDKSGAHGLLKFPPFHMEMLTQSWWSAGENMGRIKIIIAEGLMRSSAASPFERTKNIVSFSFQHAPLREPRL